MDKKLEKRIISSVTSDILRLTIYPTEQCNFRCSYCYQYYENSKMSEEMVCALLSFLNKRLNSLKVLHINWFGGEPLLAQDIIYKVSDLIQNSKKNNQSLRYIGNITTNGYLLDSLTFKDLFEHGIKTYQITLDGLESEHNKTRKLINGKGTFQKIWKNLLEIKSSNCEGNIKIRIHYNESNYKDLVPLISCIKTEFLSDKRFKIYFRPVEKFGGKNDSDIISVPYEKQKEITNYLKSYVGNNDNLYNKFENYICYASQLNSFVIRANGFIQKCDLGLDLVANNVGILNLDGTLSIDRNKFIIWSKGLETKDEEMMSCPYYYYFKKDRNL